MKILIPSDQLKLFARSPRDRPPFSEVAAVQTFKLMGWATATAGIYLLQARSGSYGLQLIPYLLAMLIVWDMAAKLGWEPEVERAASGEAYMIVSWGYGVRVLFVLLLSTFTAWAIIFWLAPLIYLHVLSAR